MAEVAEHNKQLNEKQKRGNRTCFIINGLGWTGSMGEQRFSAGK